MNFKTTIFLLALLLIAGVVLFVSQQKSEQTAPPTETHLLNISAGDVTQISLTGDDGQHIMLEKSGGKWNLTEPVKGPAEDMAVSSVIETIAGLESRGQVDLASAGVSQPHFKIELSTKDNKSIKLDVGDRSGAGDNLYVRVNGNDKADVVPASLYDQLDKPLKNWRRQKLFDVAGPEIKQLRIATTQQSIALEKAGENWTMTQPTSMPAETSEVSDIAAAISGLQASDFVNQSSNQANRYGLDEPVATVQFSTASPTTQPTTQPSFTSVKFGRFDDVMKRNVYAMTSSDPSVVIVPATVLDSLRKSPLDLRSRSILSIDPNQTTKITIESEKAATVKPAPMPAKHQTIVLERAKRVMSATMPATTQAATIVSKWKISGGADADDLKIEQLIAELNPLRVTKYLPSRPTTNPSATYTLKIDTTDAQYELRLIDPGGEAALIGSYNGLTFEVPRSIVQRLEGDFGKKSANIANETVGQKINPVGPAD